MLDTILIGRERTCRVSLPPISQLTMTPKLYISFARHNHLLINHQCNGHRRVRKQKIILKRKNFIYHFLNFNYIHIICYIVNWIESFIHDGAAIKILNQLSTSVTKEMSSECKL